MKWLKILIDSVSGKGFSRLFSGKGSLGGDYTDRQIFQQSGFTSIPSDGAQGVVLQNGQNYICIATEDNPDNVPELQNKGDVAIYSGSDYVIKISANGDIEMAGSEISVTGSNVTVAGDGTPGSINLGAGVLQNLVTETIITTLESPTTTMPVSGVVAGPYPVGTFSANPLNTTSEVQGS
jgi:hypothetical protein